MNPSYGGSYPELDEDTRRVNNAVYISRDRQSNEGEDVVSSDTESIISSLTTGTLKAPLCALEDDWSSDSSTTTTVPLKIESTRKRHDPQAYDKWLKAKNEADRKRKEQERKKKQREETRKKVEDERRKKENETKLKQWMHRKQLEEQKKSKQKPVEKTEKVDKRWIATDESNSNFEVWLNRVEEKKRQQKLRELNKQRIEEEFKQQRQDLSTMFYDEWLKTSSSKPKPVPLNQGTESLRGTVSKIFINPEPWQSNIDESQR